MPLSKRLRFSIFERDKFTCQYCGGKPPDVILEVDHMVSRKHGGDDAEMNLLTACFVCNRGKASKSVNIEGIKKIKFKKELKILEDKKEQLEAYYNFIKEKDMIEMDELNVFQECWEDCSDGENSLTESGLKKFRKLTEKYSTEMIFKAIKIVWEAHHVKPESKFVYMIGVLRNLQLEELNPEEAKARKEYRDLFYRLKNRWRQQPRGSGYLDERWMHQVMKDFPEWQIMVMMDEAQGLWGNLRKIVKDTSPIIDQGIEV